MSFGHPLLLLTLLAVPAVLLLWRLAEIASPGVGLAQASRIGEERQLPHGDVVFLQAGQHRLVCRLIGLPHDHLDGHGVWHGPEATAGREWHDIQGFQRFEDLAGRHPPALVPEAEAAFAQQIRGGRLVPHCAGW